MRRRLAHILLGIATLAGLLGIHAATAPSASAWNPVQIGWVLDFYGSTACYYDSDQPNHGWCNSYRPNDGVNFIKTAEWYVPAPWSTICGWVPQMFSGATGSADARLEWNVPPNSARGHCKLWNTGYVESSTWGAHTLLQFNCGVNYGPGTTHDDGGVLWTPGSAANHYILTQYTINSGCNLDNGARLYVRGRP